MTSASETVGIVEREELGDCELCSKPLHLGQFVNVYDDLGTAHANCEKPFAKPAEETPAPADDGSTMPTYVLLGDPALLEALTASHPQPSPEMVQAATIAERDALLTRILNHPLCRVDGSIEQAIRAALTKGGAE